MLHSVQPNLDLDVLSGRLAGSFTRLVYLASVLRIEWLKKRLNIDEFLVKFKGRSRHTMNIAAKAGGKGFKIYGVACGDYLIDFLFSSKVRDSSNLAFP